MRRCHDCLDDIPEDAEAWMVLRQMRDIPADTALRSLAFDSVEVCKECAGWDVSAINVGEPKE